MEFGNSQRSGVWGSASGGVGSQGINYHGEERHGRKDKRRGCLSFRGEEVCGREDKRRGSLAFRGEEVRGQEDEKRVRKRITRKSHENDVMSGVLLVQETDRDDDGSSVTD